MHVCIYIMYIYICVYMYVHERFDMPSNIVSHV